MGCNKSVRPHLTGQGPCVLEAQRDPGAPLDSSVTAILGAHTEKFDDILNAVQSIKSILEPKIDALHIDVGHLREEHKKLKDRVTTTEGTISELCPSLANATKHIKDLQKEVLHLCQRLEDQEATMERERAHAEVELRVGSPVSSSVESVEQQDKTPRGLDEEQLRVALSGGPKVTPQTAEDVL
ncbi:hypothetical protein NDU88_001898 [Pleurodeles waltl]|uniref:Uncharacterized protein n=1 Tax=Pleurodeles waltl TaxID=8319 RepID=A0AAV7TLN8_PLEWA|nr:hypothetical protein NDU88_001898 [Pleurodeles waltl]